MKCTLTVLSLLKATDNHCSDFEEAEFSEKSVLIASKTNTLSKALLKKER